MKPPGQFKSEIVEILVDRFRSDPNSLPEAFTVLWSIDSYANHVACYLGQDQIAFKNGIQAGGGWQFRLVREASSATKHAVRNFLGSDIPSSENVASADFTSFAWYFSGAKHWGHQICITVDWEFDENLKLWRTKERGKDRKTEIVVGQGPFIKTVPILDLIDPALSSIEIYLP